VLQRVAVVVSLSTDTMTLDAPLYGTIDCSVLHCVAVCCSEVQCVTVVVGLITDTMAPDAPLYGIIYCSVLQYVAVYCSVLQCW